MSTVTLNEHWSTTFKCNTRREALTLAISLVRVIYKGLRHSYTVTLNMEPPA